MHQKSNTCRSKTTGNPLNEYSRKQDALDHAQYLRNGSEPYKCKVCNKYHLAPKSRITKSKPSACLDHNGQQKMVYQTKKAADRRAEILKEEQGVTLSIYKCGMCKGWHLTKHN